MTGQPRWRTPLRRRRPLRRKPQRAAQIAWRPLVAATDAQRAKVAGARCLVCERTPVDPAHLVPQRLGGCGHPDCAVPLCRTHHRLYDRAELNLLAYLDDRWRAELAHAASHVDPDALRAALAGRGWPDDPAHALAGG